MAVGIGLEDTSCVVKHARKQVAEYLPGDSASPGLQALVPERWKAISNVTSVKAALQGSLYMSAHGHTWADSLTHPSRLTPLRPQPDVVDEVDDL